VRKFLILTLLICITAGGAYAYESSAIDFDRQKIQKSLITNEFQYSDYKPTAVSAKLKLNSENIFIELLPNEKSDEIKIEVLQKEIIDKYQGEDLFEDFVTASDPDYPAPEKDRLGQNPIYLGDELVINHTRYARLRVFPVTVDSSGNIIFNKALDIKIGNRTILPSELLTDEDISLLKSASKNNETQGLSSSDNTEYVIITSSPLFEPCSTLAEYKNATGIKTEVRLAEDILSLYSGRDDAEKLREYLKLFYADGGKYVLMAGDESILPIRYAYHSSTSSNVAVADLQIADLYFADIDGDWNADGDNIWGERNVDQADLTPELYVGRLPFNTAEQMNNYVDKLIAYETNPGNGNTDYLDRTLFFCSDQMRDYPDGQHGFIAQAFPEYFEIDSTEGVETPTGLDPNPYNPSAYELTDHISEGFGIVHIIAHGRMDAFGVWTNGYNNWPKSYFISGPANSTHGSFLNLNNNNRVSFYYSLACDNGAFDKDIAEYGDNGHLIVSELLSIPGAGAIGFVANSRWGWIGSSYYLQEKYFSTLFANPDKPAIEAMYASKEMYYYYRDLVLGQNFYGDPTLKIYTAQPQPQAALVTLSLENKVTITTDGQPLENSHIIISMAGDLVEEGYTTSSGEYSIQTDLVFGIEYTLASVNDGYTTSLTRFTPSLATDIEDDYDILPTSYALYQNYPNPFNPTTTIQFDLPIKSDITISIYNSLGQEIDALVEDQYNAGIHTVEWDGKDKKSNQVASGIYFYRLTSEAYTDTKRMILLR